MCPADDLSVAQKDSKRAFDDFLGEISFMCLDAKVRGQRGEGVGEVQFQGEEAVKWSETDGLSW